MLIKHQPLSECTTLIFIGQSKIFKLSEIRMHHDYLIVKSLEIDRNDHHDQPYSILWINDSKLTDQWNPCDGKTNTTML